MSEVQRECTKLETAPPPDEFDYEDYKGVTIGIDILLDEKSTIHKLIGAMKLTKELKERRRLNVSDLVKICHTLHNQNSLLKGQIQEHRKKTKIDKDQAVPNTYAEIAGAKQA